MIRFTFPLFKPYQSQNSLFGVYGEYKIPKKQSFEIVSPFLIFL